MTSLLVGPCLGSVYPSLTHAFLVLCFLYEIYLLFPNARCSPSWRNFKPKIAQTKDKMHKTRERVLIDRLWPEMATLNWVLNEILVLRQRDEAYMNQEQKRLDNFVTINNDNKNDEGIEIFYANGS